jgi:hypothetical protein
MIIESSLRIEDNTLRRARSPPAGPRIAYAAAPGKMGATTGNCLKGCHSAFEYGLLCKILVSLKFYLSDESDASRGIQAVQQVVHDA